VWVPILGRVPNPAHSLRAVHRAADRDAALARALAGLTVVTQATAFEPAQALPLVVVTRRSGV